MPGEKITELVILLDRSLSMYGKERRVVGAANSLIRKYRSEKESCFVTVCLFSDRLDVVYMNQEGRFAKELSLRDYFVEGNTALYDAFGELVFYMEHTMRYLKDDLVDGVHFYILTDGTDNASIRTTSEEYAALLEEKRARRWQIRTIGFDEMRQ